MNEPQNYANWSERDFDPSNRPRNTSVEWWNENYVAPARRYRESYNRKTQEEKEQDWRSYPDPLLNPGCPLYWSSCAQDPSIVEIEEEENSQENQLSDESLAELNEQLQASRRTIVLPEVSSDVSATSAEAEVNMAIAEMDAYVNQVFEDASQELFKAYAETVPDTREWETKRMDAGPTIGKNERVYPGIRRRQLRNYFRTQMRPSEFALGAVASGALPDLYDPGSFSEGIWQIYRGSVSVEYWDVTPKMYLDLKTDAGAIAYLEDVLKGNIPASGWSNKELEALRGYVNEWKWNVQDYYELFPGENIPEETDINTKISPLLKEKTEPFYIEPSTEDIVRQRNQQLYESTSQIIEKVKAGEPLPPGSTQEEQLLYQYYHSYYYYEFRSQFPVIDEDDIPERRISPEEVIDSILNNQNSTNNSIPDQSNSVPGYMDIEFESVNDYPLDENNLDAMLREIIEGHSKV